MCAFVIISYAQSLCDCIICSLQRGMRERPGFVGLQHWRRGPVVGWPATRDAWCIVLRAIDLFTHLLLLISACIWRRSNRCAPHTHTRGNRKWWEHIPRCDAFVISWQSKILHDWYEWATSYQICVHIIVWSPASISTCVYGSSDTIPGK